MGSAILTFDDGPKPETTPLILDILLKYGIRAVFFVVGRRIDAPGGEAVLKRILDEGHLIGNHTYSHPHLPKLDSAEIRAEIERNDEILSRLNVSTRLFRPPFGEVCPKSRQIIQELGFSEVLWSLDTKDWERKENGAWVEFGLSELDLSIPTNVILLHDIQRSTGEHLERFILALQEKNIDFADPEIEMHAMRRLPEWYVSQGLFT